MTFSIIFGGKSSEHDVTVNEFNTFYRQYLEYHTTQEASLQLSTVYYITRQGDVLITPVNLEQPSEFYWRESDNSVSLVDALRHMQNTNDFLFCIVYGQFVEDGNLQGAATLLNLQGNFGSTLSCSLAMSKYHMQQFITATYPALRTPHTLCFTEEDDFYQILKHFSDTEIIIKPNGLGSSVHTQKMRCCSENFSEIEACIQNIFNYDERVLVQKYLTGEEYTCYCLEHDGRIEALGVKKMTAVSGFLGFSEKYTLDKELDEVYYPNTAPLPHKIQKMLLHSSKIVRNLGFRNMCRIDYILHTSGQLYLLEANALPCLSGFAGAWGVNSGVAFPSLDLVRIFMENEARRTQKMTTFYATVEK